MKQHQSVDSFVRGSFCGVDPKDIPNGGFALSLNIDPTKKIGAAVPRNNDVFYISDEENVGAGTGMCGAFEIHNGANRLTFLSSDAATDKLYYSEDKAAYASKNVSEGFEDSGRGRFISAADGSIRMAVGSAKNPQYFAKIDRTQYPSTSVPIVTDAYTMLDAHVFPPTAFGSVISADWDGANEWHYLLNNNPYLFRAELSTDIPFEHTRSDIAMAHPIKIVGVYDNDEIYVLDDAVNKIYVFNEDTLAKEIEIDLKSLITSVTQGATVDWDGDEIATGFDVYRESATVVFIAVCWIDLTESAGAEGRRIVSILKNDNGTVTFVGSDWSDDENTAAEGLYVDRALKYVDGSTDSGGVHFLNRGYEDVCISRSTHLDKTTGTKTTVTIAATRNIDEASGSALTAIDYYEFNLTDEIFDGTAHEGWVSTKATTAGYSYQGIAWAQQVGNEDRFVVLYRIYTDPTIAGVSWEHFTDAMYLGRQQYNWDTDTASISTGGLALTDETWITRDHLRLAPYSGFDNKILMAAGGAPSVFITNNITTDGTANTAWTLSSFGITGRLIDGKTTGNITSEKKVYYKVAVVYDNSQMSALSLSPIVYAAWVRDSVTGSTTSEADYLSYEMQIMIPSGVNNVRWTSIMVFRAEASLHESDVPESAYQFIYEIPLDDETIPKRKNIVSWDYLTGSSYNRYVIKTTDKVPSSGITYKSFNGIPDTQPDTIMKYKFCTTGNGQSFVLGCTHPRIDDIHHYLFKSKRNLLDTFDWSSDFAKLPLSGEPTGIGYFQGRAICFDKSTMIVVNERTMAIENVYKGVGCISHETIVSTKFGLFWADSGHVYQWSGGQPIVISEVVENDGVLSTWGWKGMSNPERSSAAFDTSRLQYILFMGKDGSNVGLVAVFTISQNRWDFIELTTGSYVSPTWFTLFSNLEGDVAVPLVNSTTFRVHRIYGDSSNRAAIVYSKNHTFGNPNIETRLLDMIMHHTGTPNVAVSYDEAGYSDLTEVTEVANKVFRSVLNTKAFMASFKFSIAATAELSSYATSYRGVTL